MMMLCVLYIFINWLINRSCYPFSCEAKPEAPQSVFPVHPEDIDGEVRDMESFIS